MTKEEAIKLAFDRGGYDFSHAVPMSLSFMSQGWVKNVKNKLILQDHYFWQALSEALGWGYEILRDPCDVYSQEEWEDKAHEWFQSILDGTEDEFWKELN